MNSSDFEFGRTWRHQQRFDVVGVEKSHQMIERANEPAAGVQVCPHQLICLLETFFAALHLKNIIKTLSEEITEFADLAPQRLFC